MMIPSGTFTEIETGKGSDALDRGPKLADALKFARKRKAPVIVANRLSRDIHFISGLMAQRVPGSQPSLPSSLPKSHA
jgi:hypothetical protein